jgi:hypothetical protein
MPFDESVFGKKLEAETRAETEESHPKQSDGKGGILGCTFLETVKNAFGCIFCKKKE